jgi:hypothetical protein
MRNALFAIVLVALLPVSSVAAEQPRTQKSDKPVSSGRQLPLKGAAKGNPCAVYGPGFVRVEGAETCVKVGGAVSVGIGASR